MESSNKHFPAEIQKMVKLANLELSGFMDLLDEAQVSLATAGNPFSLAFFNVMAKNLVQQLEKISKPQLALEEDTYKHASDILKQTLALQNDFLKYLEDIINSPENISSITKPFRDGVQKRDELLIKFRNLGKSKESLKLDQFTDYQRQIRDNNDLFMQIVKKSIALSSEESNHYTRQEAENMARLANFGLTALQQFYLEIQQALEPNDKKFESYQLKINNLRIVISNISQTEKLSSDSLYDEAKDILSETQKLQDSLFNYLLQILEKAKIPKQQIENYKTRYATNSQTRDIFLSEFNSKLKDLKSHEASIMSHEYQKLLENNSQLLTEIVATIKPMRKKLEVFEFLSKSKGFFLALEKKSGPLRTLLDVLNPAFGQLIQNYEQAFRNRYGSDKELQTALSEYFINNDETQLQSILDIDAKLVDFLHSNLLQLSPIFMVWEDRKKDLQKADYDLVEYNDVKRDLANGLGKHYGEDYSFSKIPEFTSSTAEDLQRGIFIAINDLVKRMQSGSPPPSDKGWTYFKLIEKFVKSHHEMADLMLSVGGISSPFTKRDEIMKQLQDVEKKYFPNARQLEKEKEEKPGKKF